MEVGSWKLEEGSLRFEVGRINFVSRNTACPEFTSGNNETQPVPNLLWENKNINISLGLKKIHKIGYYCYWKWVCGVDCRNVFCRNGEYCYLC
jgi:hypothetical protein